MSKPLYEIEGFEELLSKLKQLPDKVTKRELLKILGQVANPTLKAARVEVPVSKKPHLISGKRTRKIVTPGNLNGSLGKIVGKRGFGRQNAVLYVGPKTKGVKNDGWYGAFVQSGTKHQTANPFMKRAYEKTKGLVSADAEQKVARYIQKQIDRLSNA